MENFLIYCHSRILGMKYSIMYLTMGIQGAFQQIFCMDRQVVIFGTKKYPM